ncbi:uncharacterized protein K452DRAFT_275434 [Aplosporella prunicola CBS 121167]|uniref:Carboxylic ester hydrolase n=1 Tax=Aplosporella prunicola CBS 121167 TaxID=1176127 RepID=A0A6A6B544_9PEZI|nr:uncharacterized protein K452DRAFT_275434 [Aplosporella prunicola CBS 121167]KAF2139272.1 hypothetical protein K452DRAFT_275434 [Aplosporella prunicola CBS 121167]
MRFSSLFTTTASASAPASLLLLLLGAAAGQQQKATFEQACGQLPGALGAVVPNATVWFSSFVAGGTNLSLADNNATCTQPSQAVTADMCRVALRVPTSNRSEISMEAWLPANWTGRFLSTGNGGVGGCVAYDDLAYAAGLGFAAVGANNGHNGTSGGAFYNNADVVEDFAWRSVHTGVVLGKRIANAFYGRKHDKSYYLGCSTGGRQGFKSAQSFPDDFDGVVAGAPAIAFNNLSSWSGHFYTLTGSQDSESFVPLDMWTTIHESILAQCDDLDGAKDGIIEDPLRCEYDATALACGGAGVNASACLTPAQVTTVQGVFSNLTSPDGSLVYPRMQPGSEATDASALYAGQSFPYTNDWFRYAIYNDPAWDPAQLNASDYAAAAAKNPGDIETWNGDLEPFRARGAKILHYHGQMDGIISSENSPRYWRHVADTMGLQADQLDAFYRFFRISGMNHCEGGDGAWAVGQRVSAQASLDPEKNVLMAIVRWVEEGVPPETVTGTKWVDDDPEKGVEFTRAHCRFPKRNQYSGKGDVKDPASWECVA